MGQKLKTSKGEISISSFQERIGLRWRYAGERYSLNLPYAYLPENLHHGTVKVTEIKRENWSVTTYNRRLGYLTTFFTWLVSKRVIDLNPLQDVCRKREKKRKKNPRRIPLEEGEILAFLEAIKNNTYCHPSSAVKHSYYYPFLSFIFYTGVRNAEAIGLRVRHVDFDNKTVEISEAFARTVYCRCRTRHVIGQLKQINQQSIQAEECFFENQTSFAGVAGNTNSNNLSKRKYRTGWHYLFQTVLYSTR